MIRLPAYALLIPLLPLAVYIGADAVLFHAGLSNEVVGGLTVPASIPASAAYTEAAVRYSFLASVPVATSLALVTIAVFLAELFSTDPATAAPRYHPQDRARVAITFLILAGVGWSYFDATAFARLYDRLGADLFEATLFACTSLGQDPSCLFGTATDPPFEVTTGFNLSIQMGVAGSMAGVAAAAFGTVLALAQSDEALLKGRETVFRLPNLFLYLASGLFTVGMLGLVIWMGFPKAILSSDDLKAYRDLTGAVSIYFGLAYSLVILSFHLPTVAILNARIACAARGQPEAEAQGTPLVKLLENALAVMAPLIAPLVTSFGASTFAGAFGGLSLPLALSALPAISFACDISSSCFSAPSRSPRQRKPGSSVPARSAN